MFKYLKLNLEPPSNFSIRDQASMSQTWEASIDNLPTGYDILHIIDLFFMLKEITFYKGYIPYLYW